MLRAYSTDLFRPALGRTKNEAAYSPHSLSMVQLELNCHLSSGCQTVVGLAAPISHLELYNVWERSVGEGGRGRAVGIARFESPPPAPSPPTGEPNTQHVRSSSIGADKNKQHLLQTSRLHVWNVAGLGFNCNPHILA